MLLKVMFLYAFVMSKFPGKKTAFQGRPKQILIRIADSKGSLTTSDLVDMLGMTRPNTCTYLTKLQEEGFIETKQGVSDKRRRYHSLTAKGREYMDSWAAERDSGRGGFVRHENSKRTKPQPISASAVESVDDLLEDCDKIVYDGEIYDVVDPEF